MSAKWPTRHRIGQRKSGLLAVGYLVRLPPMNAPDFAAGLAALRGLVDIVKGLGDLNERVAANTAVLELQQLMLESQTFNQGLMKENDDLNRELAKYTQWQAEERAHQLQELAPGVFAVKKRAFEADEPPHYLCPHCFLERKKSILQALTVGHSTYRCHACDAKFPTQSVASVTTISRPPRRLSGL